MIDIDRPHESSTYGWVVYAAAALRWLARVLGANPCLKDERAAALQILDGGLNHPSGPH
jgi:hypothetical protein